MLDYLLALEPADGVVAPRRGRWTLEDRIAKRRNAIDLTLLQAATGLRVSEANALTWHRHIEFGDGGAVHVVVTEDISKTHKARRVPVLDDRVAARLRDRRRLTPTARAHVIGAPTNPMSIWDRDNCQKTMAELYLELAKQLEIELLNTERTHVWRATLNSLVLDQVPEVVRSAYFGHDAAVNRSAYTDVTDTSAMVSAARRLWNAVQSEVDSDGL